MVLVRQQTKSQLAIRHPHSPPHPPTDQLTRSHPLPPTSFARTRPCCWLAPPKWPSEMDVDNVHHHLAVVVPKTFHTPRPMSYWNEMSEMSAVLYLPPPPVTHCGCTAYLLTQAPCWGLYKAQLVDQPGRNAQSMRHLPHTETLCSPTTNHDAFYTTVPWYRAVGTNYRSGLRGSQ